MKLTNSKIGDNLDINNGYFSAVIVFISKDDQYVLESEDGKLRIFNEDGVSECGCFSVNEWID